MKRLILLALLVASQAFGATKTWTGGDLVNDDWSDADNWDAGVPTAADAAVFDPTSAGSPCVIDVNAACLTLTCTGYTGAISFNDTLEVSGNVTFAPTMTLAGTAGAFIINANSTITSAGLSIPCSMTYGKTAAGALTLTLADTLTCARSFTILSSAAGGRSFTGRAIKIAGDLSVVGLQTNTISGTTVFILNGTGTVTSSLGVAGTTGTFGQTITINTAGTITFSGNFTHNGGLIYTAGTVIPPDTLKTRTGNCTWTVNGMTWKVIRVGTAATITLNNRLVAESLVLMANTTFAGASGGFTTTRLVSDPGLTHSLLTGVEYITSYLDLQGTSGSPITIASSNAVTSTLLTLTGRQKVSYVTATRVNSGNGKRIYDPGGTLTTTVNWSTFPLPLANSGGGAGFGRAGYSRFGWARNGWAR